MGKDLSHLTSEEIETLMRRYYDGEAVSKLIKEYNISVHASELYKLFPPEVYQNYSCEYCAAARRLVSVPTLPEISASRTSSTA